MRDLINGNHSDEVWMCDGIVTVISRLIFNEKICDYEHAINRYILHPEYNHVITLSDILDRYPSVIMVIHETANGGSIYRYDNHYDGEWEKVGTTVGYA